MNRSQCQNGVGWRWGGAGLRVRREQRPCAEALKWKKRMAHLRKERPVYLGGEKEEQSDLSWISGGGQCGWSQQASSHPSLSPICISKASPPHPSVTAMMFTHSSSQGQESSNVSAPAFSPANLTPCVWFPEENELFSRFSHKAYLKAHSFSLNKRL